MAQGVPLVRRFCPAQHDRPGQQPQPPRTTKHASALDLEVRCMLQCGRRGVGEVLLGHGTGEEAGVCARFMHSRSRMTIWYRPSHQYNAGMGPERGMSGFHRPDRHRVHQERSAAKRREPFGKSHEG